MELLMIQLNSNCKPLLNQTYINTTNPNFAQYKMYLEKSLVRVVHQERGTFWVPLTSISFMQVDPKSLAPSVSKKAPRRPKSITVRKPATDD